MQTEKDAEIVSWLGRIGAASAEHVMAALAWAAAGPTHASAASSATACSSITPHGESAKQVVSHGTGQNDLAAIGSEEVIQNVLGVGVTGSGESAKYYTRDGGGALLAKRTAKGKPSETEYFVLDPFGSVAMLTSASGTQTAPSSGTYQYDPYGEIGSSPGPAPC